MKHRIIIWGSTLLGVLLLVLLGVGTYFYFASTPFLDERLLTDFRSYATRLIDTQRFQFSTLEQIEVFEKRSTATLFWNRLALPEVIVSATAPVAYTYYVSLEDKWQFRREGRRLVVSVPKIHYNRPALDFSQLKFEVKKGSLLRNERKVMDNLRAGISELLEKRALANVELVRERGRRQIELFVRTWFKDQYPHLPELRLEVKFGDESKLP